MSFKPFLLVSSLALCACSATTASVKPDVDCSSPDKAAAPAVKPAPTAAVEKEVLSKAPEVPSFEDMGRLAAGEELAEVSKAFEAKLFFDGQEQLESHRKSARGGSIDYQLQTYAMSGYAHAMMGENDLALRGYRKVLSMWRHPAGIATKLRRAHPEDGDVRVERAMDAFGEALFFMAERKRARLDEIDFPYNDVGDEPHLVKKFVSRNLKQWLRKRTQRTSAAVAEYQRIDRIKPESPSRWIMASHARQGLMVAQTLQHLRDFGIPASWDEKGESAHKGADGKPMSWESIRTEHKERMSALTEPLMEQAKTEYQACVDTAAEANIDNKFSRECKRWLKANR